MYIVVRVWEWREGVKKIKEIFQTFFISFIISFLQNVLKCKGFLVEAPLHNFRGLFEEGNNLVGKKVSRHRFKKNKVNVPLIISMFKHRGWYVFIWPDMAYCIEVEFPQFHYLIVLSTYNKGKCLVIFKYRKCILLNICGNGM